jgi:hypothetical protein
MTKSATIYHYTTISGLIGIITSRELWASDCRFLNDGTELSYARNIFFAEVKKLKLAPVDGGGYMIPGGSLKHFLVFVACFCEDGDLLSQWRGYGTDQGYALGFDTTQLQALNLGEVGPVHYGITNPSEYFAQELDSATQPTAHPGVAEWHASQWILPRLARVKHPGFAEEHEWRLLKQVWSYELKAEDTTIRFRPSPMGPIAYVVIPFPPECLREIVIGPGAHTKTREAAVRSMLDYHDLPDIKLRVSKIPFRR